MMAAHHNIICPCTTAYFVIRPMGDLAASSGAFCNNEKVLVCVYTDKYYEAKVLRSEVRGDGMRYYLLHYTGWNKKWDEWVEETGLQKCPQGTQTHNNGKKGPKSGTVGELHACLSAVQ